MLKQQVLSDKKLSWECKGLLLFLLSFKKMRTVKKIIKANVCAPYTTRKILKELEEKGFIENLKQKNAKGQFTSTLILKQ